MNGEEKFKKLIEKIESLKKNDSIDLSTEEDLSIAIMNLLSLEEHFFFTASKTGKLSYFDLLDETRQIRKELLSRMITKTEGETWCISKHLLAATMRLIEVGTKLKSDGKTKEAEDIFAKAYKIYSFFWAVRLRVVDVSDAKKIQDDKLSANPKLNIKKPWSTEDIVNKLVDCCDE